MKVVLRKSKVQELKTEFSDLRERIRRIQADVDNLEDTVIDYIVEDQEDKLCLIEVEGD
jgi:hypothetical protein